jgi:hypothetical protein
MPNTRHAADTLDATRPEYKAFARYVSLISRKRAVRDELDDIEAALKAMEPQLLAYLGEGPDDIEGAPEESLGFSSVRLGGYTIYPQRDPWVKAKAGATREDVCRALKESGLGHYVTEQFNTRSLTKYVHDLEKKHNVLADQNGALARILPAELVRVLEVKPAFRIQALRK